MTFDLNLPKRVELVSRCTHIPKFRPLGPLAAAGQRVTYGRKARKYITWGPASAHGVGILTKWY